MEGKTRSIGAYIRSGNFSDYWRTKISFAGPGKILVRGYPVEELMEHLSYVECVWLLIRGELPAEREAAIFELAMKSAMDQQFVNSAVCAARYTASAFPESPVPAIASGILATGSVTGSPQECAEMLYNAHALMLREGLSREETARRVVTERMEKKGRVPGLGHPIHKEGEPRAETLRRLVKELGGWGEKSQLFDAIRDEFTRRTGKPLPLNLAGAIACVMSDLGFHPLEIGGFGAVGYGMALIAHVVEEILEGVPLRIIPEALGAKYVGPRERHLPPERLRAAKK